MRALFAIGTLCVAMGCTENGEMDDRNDDAERVGLKSVYMGHSYFRRQAEAMNEYADIAGVIGHESYTLFRGGYNGSAYAIWEHEPSKTDIQDRLNVGDTEMFGMTLFVESDVPASEGSHIDNQIQGLKNWMEYARTQNSETIFFVALPWLGGPLTYVGETGDPHTSGYEEYGEVIRNSEVAVQGVVDELRDEFTDSEIFLLAYGQGALELRTLYNQGNLPDVDTLVTDGNLLGIHKDTHGHAEQMLTDLNTLVWLESIYDVNVLDFDKDYTYQTDIKAIAHDVANRQDADYIRQF